MTDTIIICQNPNVGKQILVPRIFEHHRIPFVTLDFLKEEKEAQIRQENFNKMMQQELRKNFDTMMSLFN